MKQKNIPKTTICSLVQLTEFIARYITIDTDTLHSLLDGMLYNSEIAPISEFKVDKTVFGDK